MTDNIASVETDAKTLASGTGIVALWLRKIEKACDEEREWHESAEAAIKVYEADDESTQFNILHSNVETLGPALYNSSPVPDVRRRYGDADPIAKMVVDMTERCLSYTVDQYDFDATMQGCVLDALVTGRGTVRVRYEPQMTQQPDPMTGEPIEVKAWEDVKCELVPWDRFVRGPGRLWADVPFVAFKHYLTRDELVQLNPEIGEEISVALHKDKDDKDDDAQKGVMSTALVWEIWDKRAKEVIFIAAEFKDAPILVRPDPLGMQGFFPVPQPLYAIRRVSSLTPVCPYRVYKSLIDELDDNTRRIKRLIKLLKVRGLVAGSMAKELDALRTVDDGEYITADDAAGFVSGGGKLENGIAHMPLEPIVSTLKQLYEQRERTKQTIYEVTGLSDILRGASQASETATAQQIKSQWGSLRIQRMQREVQRMARDLFRMKAELIAEHFDPKTIVLMANFENVPQEQAQVLPQALELFKSGLRAFRIDIETDSTVRADMTRNQEQMNMFLAGSGQFVQGMMGAAQLMPNLLPAMVEIYTAFARNFSLGKQAEDALDRLSQMAPAMVQAATQQKGQDPEAENRKAELEMQREKHGQEMQREQMKTQGEAQKLQFAQQDREHKLQTDMMRAQMAPQNPNGAM